MNARNADEKTFVELKNMYDELIGYRAHRI